MLIKIMFTVAVIIGVVIFFRMRPAARAHAAAEQRLQDAQENGRSISPRALAYGIFGILVGVSALFFTYHWQIENRIVTLRVFSAGDSVDYQARYKSIKGRTFTTLDNARITLGDSDRIEMLEP